MTTIGLAQAFNRLGHKAVVAMREPSLGPVSGLKAVRPEEGILRSYLWKI